MFHIEDGREHFYQWDTNRRLIIDDETITEVHFCNRSDSCSLVVEVYTEDNVRFADVPNVLLQNDFTVKVYGFCGNCYTKLSGAFKVRSRTKPADYVYTETEVLNYSTLLERIEELEEKEVDVDLTDYYTKEETEAKIAEVDGVKEVYVGGETPPEGVGLIWIDSSKTAPDYATKEYVNNAVASGGGGADLSDYYTKDETDSALNTLEMNISNWVSADIEKKADKTELDNYVKDTDLVDASVAYAEEANSAYAADYASRADYDSEWNDIIDTYATKEEIKGFTTMEQVQTAINTALGVIENGTY